MQINTYYPFPPFPTSVLSVLFSPYYDMMISSEDPYRSPVEGDGPPVTAFPEGGNIT